MTNPAIVNKKPLYETDYPLWAHLQAAYLRARQWDKLDIDALAEEIDDMGRRDKDAIESHLENLLFHLLKWQYQPGHRANSWLGSIRVARERIILKIERAPSLANYPATVLEDAYRIARKHDPENDMVKVEDFPSTCPWSIEEVLDEGWLPDDRSGLCT